MEHLTRYYDKTRLFILSFHPVLERILKVSFFQPLAVRNDAIKQRVS